MDRKSINLLDESMDEFQQNFKIINENKLKLANISKYLVPKTSLEASTEVIEKEKKKQKNESTTSKISKYFSTSTSLNNNQSPQVMIVNRKEPGDKLNTKFSCPLCSIELTDEDEQNRQLHVNKCLDKFSKIKIKPSDDETAASSSSKIDEKEEEKKASKENVDKKLFDLVRNTGIPNCPICGKINQTLNSNQTHLKKCAQIFHIKPDSLVELVKKQRERILNDLNNGFIPQDVFIPKAKTDAKTTANKRKQPSRILKLEQPSNQQDEELVTAIALSKSLCVEEEHVYQLQLNKGLKIMSKKSKKDLNSYRESKFLLTDDEDRRKYIDAKLLEILGDQVDLSVKFKPSSLVQSKFSDEFNYLWEKCKYFSQPNESFYVNMFIKNANFNVGGRLFLNKTQTSESNFADITIINTQTAFLLADLNNTTTQQLNITNSQIDSSFSQTILTPFGEVYQSQLTEEVENFYFELTETSEIKNQETETDLKLVESSLDSNTALVSKEEFDQTTRPVLSKISEILNFDDKITEEEDVRSFSQTIPTPSSEVFQSQLTEKVENFNFELIQTSEIKNQEIETEKIESFSFNSDTGSETKEEFETVIRDQTTRPLLSKISEILNFDDTITEEEEESSQIKGTQHLLRIDDTFDETLIEENIKMDVISINSDDDDDDCAIILDESNHVSETAFIIDDDSISVVSVPKDEASSPSSELPSLDFKIDNNDTTLKAYGKRKSMSLDNIFMENENKIIKLDDTADVDEENISSKQQTEDENNFDDIWNNFDENQCDDNYNYEPIIHDEQVSPTKKILDFDEICLDDENSIFEAIEGPSEIKSPMAKEFMKPLKTPKLASLAREEAIFNSPLTPMPTYVTMESPILKNELKRFGVKALPKKQAVRKLVEIYEYTHRHKLPKSKSCSDFVENHEKKSSSTTDEPPATSILKPKKSKLKKTVSNIDSSDVRIVTKKTKSKEKNDMSIFENDDQIPLSSQSKTQMVDFSDDEIKQEVFNFIFNDSELYTNVLNYEPLDFENFYQQIKGLGKFKISTKFLMHILDEKCVTFTMKSIRFRSRKK